MRALLSSVSRVVTVFAVAALASQAAAADLLVGAFPGGLISQFDGATGGFEGTLEPAGTTSIAAAGALQIGPDGQLWVGAPGALGRFDLATGAYLGPFVSGLPGNVLNFVFAPDGTIWGTTGPGNALFHVSGTSGLPIGPLVTTTFPTGIDLGPDGKLYVANGPTGQISRFDPATGALLGSFTVPISGAQLTAIRFGPDGKLYVPIASHNDIVRYTAETAEYLGSFIPPGDTHPSVPYFLAWGPDGDLYVTANGPGEVLRYDETTGAFLGVFATGASNASGLVFVPDRTAYLPACPSPLATSSGPVCGVSSGGVRSFKGIRYAQAPTGELRWKRPVPESPSPTNIYALSHGPTCPQPGGGNEDCLKLSIWRPDSVSPTPRPVLVFIHGGNFSLGSIGPDAGQLALTQNLIVVEIQYRLGVFGFFGLPALAGEDPNGSTGNYGLLDQLQALRWVHDNIAVFGGDSANVTVAGQSAGGASVYALLASPLSDGLFQRGIAMSGAGINAYALQVPDASLVRSDPLIGDSIYVRSRNVALAAACADGAGQVTCLRGLDANVLVNALSAQPPARDGAPWARPAVDGYVLTEQPRIMLAQGAADGRALMQGSVANESTYYTQYLALPSQAIYELYVHAASGDARANAVLPLFPASSFGGSYENAFRAILDDGGGYTCPTLDIAGRIAAAGSPNWVYHLSFAPTYPPGSPNAYLRTFHGLDVLYLFGSYGNAGIQAGPNDATVAASIQAAFGSFARTGTPVTTPAWPSYSPAIPGDLASVSVLQFDVPNILVSGAAFRSGRCAALVPVADQLDPDRDVATSEEDDCPVTANTSQADAESDSVGDACDNCRYVSNPRVAADYLVNNPWATLTGGQRDDDHDGYGNKCDADFTPAGLNVGTLDVAQYNASSGKSRVTDTCGTSGNRPCAIFDLDEGTGLNIGTPDKSRLNVLIGFPAGGVTPAGSGKCPTCPLTCTAGTAGSCD